MGQSGEAGNWRMTRVTARNSIIVIVIIFIIVIIDHCHHICSHYHHHHPNSSNRSNLSGLKAHRPILFPGWSKAFMCSLPGFDNDHSPTRVSSLCFALQWECGVTQVAGTSHHHHHPSSSSPKHKCRDLSAPLSTSIPSEQDQTHHCQILSGRGLGFLRNWIIKGQSNPDFFSWLLILMRLIGVDFHEVPNVSDINK